MDSTAWRGEYLGEGSRLCHKIKSMKFYAVRHLVDTLIVLPSPPPASAPTGQDWLLIELVHASLLLLLFKNNK